MVRAAHGMVPRRASSLIYYQIQAWPAKHRLKALTIGITRSLPSRWPACFFNRAAQLDEWRGLYFLRAGTGADLPGLRHRLKITAGRPAQGL